jgi:hypothetical protein
MERFGLLSKIAKGLTRHPSIILTIAIVLLIPSVIGYAMTRVNYDILSYLPKNLNSTRGEDVLENTFHDAATSMLVIDGMDSKDVVTLKKKIEKVPGVNNVIWVDDVADISIPKEMLPTLLKDTFYSDNSTLVLITYDGSSSSNETLDTVGRVRKLLNKQCFLSGVSAITRDTKDLTAQELPIYVGLAVALSLLAMSLCMQSWVLPFVFILGIGFAVAYNFGSNVFMGQISYVTQAIAGILQLGVTMDYSIFLINRYDEEKPKFQDRRDAMASAIQSTFTSLAGSSLTTVAGFFALCFMQLTLGRDIGIVMMKGVILGVLTTVTVLPSLIFVFDKPIHKYTHRSLIPDFSGGSHFLIKHRKAFVMLGLLLILPALWTQSHTEKYYNLTRSLPSNLDSVVATNKLKKDFNMATTHFIIADDSMPAYKVKEMVSKIKKVNGVENAAAYNDIIGPTIPDDFIPQKVKDLCKKDGKQLILVNSKFKAAEDAENQQIDQITSIVNQYDPSALVTGEGALTKDLITVANTDFSVTNKISMLCMLILVAIVFKSALIPFLLVAVIELAISINLGIPFLTGTVIPFITPTIIGCVQLGATVDYSILMTSRFQEELKSGQNRLEAIKIASKTSFPSIVTSSLVFFCSTAGVSLVSQIEIIQSICSTLARGALISALTIILILPGVLYVTEPLISKLSYHWKKA